MSKIPYKRFIDLQHLIETAERFSDNVFTVKEFKRQFVEEYDKLPQEEKDFIQNCHPSFQEVEAHIKFSVERYRNE